jgi:hypothetical protein
MSHECEPTSRVESECGGRNELEGDLAHRLTVGYRTANQAGRGGELVDRKTKDVI